MSISQKWKDTVDRAKTDARWDAYDANIRVEITAYQARLNKVPNFVSPGFSILKALLWTESGGPDNVSWTTRPMQIGNAGDPAYDVLKAAAEGSKLIMDATLQSELKTGNINTPSVNMRAGIAYLYTRLGKYAIRSVRDGTEKAPMTHTVAAGDTYSKIASTKGTTVDELKTSNPTVDPAKLQVGKTLKFYKAANTMVLSGWRNPDSKTVAARYNGGGDPNYAAKLDYILAFVLSDLKRP